MTTKEIQSKLIDHYSLAIERVKEAEGMDEAEDILIEMNVGFGVCVCSLMVLRTRIALEEWVERNMSGYYYWGGVPSNATTKEGILAALQLRLDILKKEYSLSIETIKPSSV